MRAAQISTGSIKELAFALTGPVLWAAHFFAVYMTEALLCNGGTSSPAVGVVRPIGVTLTVIAITALGVLVTWQALPLRRPQRGDSRNAHFLREISIALAAIALLAVIWGGLPAMLLPACMAAT